MLSSRLKLLDRWAWQLELPRAVNSGAAFGPGTTSWARQPEAGALPGLGSELPTPDIKMPSEGESHLEQQV